MGFLSQNKKRQESECVNVASVPATNPPQADRQITFLLSGPPHSLTGQNRAMLFATFHA